MLFAVQWRQIANDQFPRPANKPGNRITDRRGKTSDIDPVRKVGYNRGGQAQVIAGDFTSRCEGTTIQMQRGRVLTAQYPAARAGCRFPPCRTSPGNECAARLAERDWRLPNLSGSSYMYEQVGPNRRIVSAAKRGS